MQRLSKKIGLALVFAACSGLAVVPASADKKKDDKKTSGPAVPADAPMTDKPIKLVPDGMKWGMKREDLETLVDKFIDDDFRPKYKDAGKSAPKLKDLDSQVATMKQSFRRSWIDLVQGPTGLDASPIAPEFTKGNNEALMSHHRGPGVKIWFFFINGRLWKTYEEVSLVDGGLYGKDIGEASKMLVDGVGGTMPRAIPANPDKGQFYDVVDWQDSPTHMRVFDRNGVLAVIREEKATLANLGNLRKNTGPAQQALDPSVAAAVRGDDPNAAPPPKGSDPKDKSNKKK